MIRRLALAVASTLLALVLAEVAVRLVESRPDSIARQLERSRAARPAEAQGGRWSLFGMVQPSPNPRLVFELKPGLNGFFRGAQTTINPWGFRGRDTTIEKPPGTVRVIGIGDSMMFGWGVDDDQTYLAVAERVLREAGANVEILNFAVPGYNTMMEVEMLAAKAWHFEPDFVVLHFFDNDFDLPYFLRRTRERAWFESRLVARAKAAFGPAPAAPNLFRHGMPELEEPEKVRTWEAYARMQGEAAFREAFERLADLLASREITGLVIFPARAGEPTRTARRTASELGLSSIELDEVLDAGEEISEAEWRARYWLAEKDEHLSVEAHELLGRHLARVLDRELRVD